MVVSQAMIDMIAKQAANLIKLTIKCVMTQFRELVVQGTGSNVGKLVEEQEILTEESNEHSLLAQSRDEPQARAARYSGKGESDEVRNLRRRNASLENKNEQLKREINVHR
jgi:hypothetical protein